MLLTGTNADRFNMATLTPILKVAKLIDYENDPTTYTLAVKVKDSNTVTDQTATIPITININNVNEKPSCSPSSYFSQKDENTPTGIQTWLCLRHSKIILGFLSHPLKILGSVGRDIILFCQKFLLILINILIRIVVFLEFK